MQVCNRRYIEFISAIEDDIVGKKKLKKVTEKVTKNNRSYRGFNFFDEKDEQIFQIIASGEFNIYGFCSKNIKQFIDKSSSQISRILKRLREHGIIKVVGNTYKYYLTPPGKEVIILGEILINLYIIPSLNSVAFQ